MKTGHKSLMAESVLEQWLVPHRAVLGAGFTVGRALPFRGGRGVGPFVFLDHMGPHTFGAGEGMDVAPHPHIGLSTVTYLFEGEIEHRDSLGTVQVIRPGELNWMTAGRGIVHSERTPQARRASPMRAHGIQAWCALPVAFEEVDPLFEHFGAEALPKIEQEGVRHSLVAGAAFGKKAPVRVYSRLFYLHSEIEPGARLEFDPEGQQAAFYLVSGSVEVDGKEYVGPGLLHFKPGASFVLTARSSSYGMLLGGDALPEHRRIWWNFVSSRPERIEEAKRQWAAQAMGQVPGEKEWIPLP